MFEVLSGVVDTDTYQLADPLPVLRHRPRRRLHVIEKGSPLVQIIPFRRDTTELAGGDRPRDRRRPRDLRERILRNTHAETGWYRTQGRAKR